MTLFFAASKNTSSAEGMADADLYAFVFRGLLAEEALDRAGRSNGPTPGVASAEVAAALNLELLDSDLLQSAHAMGVVYAAIAAFENSIRRFVTKVLVDAHGLDWWTAKVSEKIRTQSDARRLDEEKTRWHSKRGDDPINYTELGQLVDIMAQNWSDFEPHVRRLEWVRELFAAVERSRNVIMHSGSLELSDIERLGIYMRDWVRQVGA